MVSGPWGTLRVTPWRVTVQQTQLAEATAIRSSLILRGKEKAMMLYKRERGLQVGFRGSGVREHSGLEVAEAGRLATGSFGMELHR